jgi:hypothetical protein
MDAGFQFGQPFYSLTLPVNRNTSLRNKGYPENGAHRHTGVHDHGFNNIVPEICCGTNEGRTPHHEWEKNLMNGLKISGSGRPVDNH